MASGDGNTGPDPLHRMVSSLREMQRRVNSLKTSLDNSRRSIVSNQVWHIDAAEAKQFLEGFTVLIRKLHQECAKLTPHDKRVSALIVDRYMANRLLYRTLLSRFGMEVYEVSSGEAAIQAHNIDGKTKYHLIIMNHDLPGICGTTTTTILRHVLHVKSLMVGVIVQEDGFDSPDSPKAIEFKDAGLDYCLKKPKLSGSVLLTVLGMFAQEEVGFHVGQAVGQVLRRVDDLELTLGLKHDTDND